MRTATQRNEASQPEKKSLLAPIILTVSAVLHVALLGYAALLPAPPKPVDPNARVQVMQWTHDEAAQTWSNEGTRWALVSRDKIQPAGE
ncbi:MAG: hypothetical protein HY898_31615 [Deltaproteobacteria bacterium]|nr:hypothetical protein [Deltaproteobacteria bacterium]